MKSNPELPWFVGAEGMQAYRSPRKYVALDFETSNKDRGSALTEDNHIVLACWDIVDGDGSVERKFKFADEYDLSELEQDIKEADFIVAHNAKFELQWLRRCGVDLREVLVFDTMLAEWVIGGNRYRPSSLGLGATAKRYGIGTKVDLAGMLIKKGVCPSTIPQRWLLKYCFKDVELSRELYCKQMEVLERDGLLHLALTRNLTCSCLADIEFNGCELDRERVSSEYEETIKKYNSIEESLVEVAGDTNLSSNKQLAELLYSKLGFSPPVDPRTKEPIKTSKGAYSTAADTMSKLVASTEVQKNFLSRYKKRNKLAALITKNLEFFSGICRDYGGVFYGILNQGFTKTHRLSSSGKAVKFKHLAKQKGAQLQNMPREYKMLFAAHDPDYLIGEADGAQLEFRVAAEMGHDEVATQEIIDGVDVHSVTAQVLTDAGEPTSRQNAKASTFAPLYGGMGKTKATKAYAVFFKEKYAGISSTQRDWAHEVLNFGKLRTPYGMIFYWPGTSQSRSGYIDNTTSIYNFPVQGFATGEIIPIALFHFWHRIRGLDITIWNTIHDSVVCRLNKNCVDTYKELSAACFTTDVYNFLEEVYNYEFSVPLAAGVKVGKNWGVSKEETIYTVYPDGRREVKVKNA